MKRIVHRAKNFHEADEWDIKQHIKMTPAERQEISRLLKVKYYGENNPDVRQQSKRE
jgi:hypothetical protein